MKHTKTLAQRRKIYKWSVWATLLTILLFLIVNAIWFNRPLGVIGMTTWLAYILYSYFTNSVEKDKRAWILWGGEPVDEVGGGYHFVAIPFAKLETVEKKFQIIWHPGEASRTATEFKVNLQPIALETDPSDTKNPLKHVQVFTPTLAQNISITAMEALADAGGTDEAVDLVNEAINAELFKQVSGMTLTDVMHKRTSILRKLTQRIKRELKGKGLNPDGPIRLVNLGIPASIAQASEAAATAIAKAEQTITEENAKAVAKERHAEARRKEMEEEAKGITALGQANAGAIRAKVDALPGTPAQKVEVLIAQETGMPTLPKGLRVLFNGDPKGGTADTVATTVAAVSTVTEEKSEKPKKEK